MTTRNIQNEQRDHAAILAETEGAIAPEPNTQPDLAHDWNEADEGRFVTSLSAFLDGLRHAHKSADNLQIAYESLVHGAFTIANPPPTLAAGNALFLEQYALAEPHVRRAFVAKILTGDMEYALPFALNGVPFPVDVPDAGEALASVVTDMDWHTLEDEAEADDQAVDVGQAMLKAAHRLREYGLANEATIRTYTALACRQPTVAPLVGLQDLALPDNAYMVALRLLGDIQARRQPDALTEGLMRALVRWLCGKVLETMAGADVLAMREDAGLTPQDLADRIGITRQHLVSLEAGEAPVSARLGRAICTVCRDAMAGAGSVATAPTVVAG